MGCWSSRQKSFSFSPCRLQFSFSSSSELCLLTCMKASQTFFRAKFEGMLDLEAFFLHTGHSRIPESQQRFRQPRQKLWLHDSKTGSVKMSQHIGHVRSSSGSDMVITKSTDSKQNASFGSSLIWFHCQKHSRLCEEKALSWKPCRTETAFPLFLT